MPTSSQALTLLKKVSDLNDIRTLLQYDFAEELDQSQTMLYMGKNANVGCLPEKDHSMLEFSLPLNSTASYRSVTPPPSSLVSSCKTTPRLKVDNTANTANIKHHVEQNQGIHKELNQEDGKGTAGDYWLKLTKRNLKKREVSSKCLSFIPHEKYPVHSKRSWKSHSDLNLEDLIGGWTINGLDSKTTVGQVNEENSFSQVQKVDQNSVPGGQGDSGISDKETSGAKKIDIPQIKIDAPGLEQGDTSYEGTEDGVDRKNEGKKKVEMSVKVLPSPEQIREINGEDLGSQLDVPEFVCEEDSRNDISYVGIQTYDHKNGRYAWSLYPHRSLVNMFALRSRQGKEINGNSNTFQSSSISYVSSPRAVKRLDNPKLPPSIFELALRQGRNLNIRGALGVNGYSPLRRFGKQEQLKEQSPFTKKNETVAESQQGFLKQDQANNQPGSLVRKPVTVTDQHKQSIETWSPPKSLVSPKFCSRLPVAHKATEPKKDRSPSPYIRDSRTQKLQSLDTNEQNATSKFLRDTPTETKGISISEALDLGSPSTKNEQEDSESPDKKTLIQPLVDKSSNDRLGFRTPIPSLLKLPPIGGRTNEASPDVEGSKMSAHEDEAGSGEALHNSTEIETPMASNLLHLAPSGIINRCNYSSQKNGSPEEEGVCILVPNCELSTEASELMVDSSVNECCDTVQETVEEPRVRISEFYEIESTDDLEIDTPKNQKTFTGLSLLQKKRLMEAKKRASLPRKMNFFKESEIGLVEDYDWTETTLTKGYEPITLDMPVITPPTYSEPKSGSSKYRKIANLSSDQSSDSDSDDLYRPEQQGLRMRRELPPVQPNKLCFRTPLTGCTHAEVKHEIETQSNVKVIFLQYDPIYIQAHSNAFQSADCKNRCMWVFELSSDSAKDKLLLEGFKLRDLKMNVRHVDDIYKEECRAFALYHEIYREQRSKKLLKRNARKALFKSGNFLVR